MNTPDGFSIQMDDSVWLRNTDCGMVCHKNGLIYLTIIEEHKTTYKQYWNHYETLLTKAKLKGPFSSLRDQFSCIWYYCQWYQPYIGQYIDHWRLADPRVCAADIDYCYTDDSLLLLYQ